MPYSFNAREALDHKRAVYAQHRQRTRCDIVVALDIRTRTSVDRTEHNPDYFYTHVIIFSDL